jgi:phosphoglycolate phosphatase
MRFDPTHTAVNGQNTRNYPGAESDPARFAAHGLPLACVTDKSQRAIEAILGQFDLARHFTCAVGGDALPQRKPAPEPFRHAADSLDMPRSGGLALGNSANGARAARAAGMCIVLVDHGYAEGRPIGGIDCDADVSSFTQLAGMPETFRRNETA